MTERLYTDGSPKSGYGRLCFSREDAVVHPFSSLSPPFPRLLWGSHCVLGPGDKNNKLVKSMSLPVWSLRPLSLASVFIIMDALFVVSGCLVHPSMLHAP